MNLFIEVLFYLFMIFLSSCMIAYTLQCIGIDYDSRRYGKNMRTKIFTIESAIKHFNFKDGKFTFNNRGKSFTLYIKNEEIGEGLHYKTIPYYSCKNVYIEDELVAKLHTLKATFAEHSIMEFSSKRSTNELDELIKAAYKEAKKLEKVYWTNSAKESDKQKSFYSK